MTNEVEYLNREAEAAREAIHRTIGEIKGELSQLGDPRTWVKQYPWISTGAGVAAGFLAGFRLTPKPSEKLEDKVSDLLDALKGRSRKAGRSGRRARHERLERESRNGHAEFKARIPQGFSFLSLVPLALRLLKKAV